MRRIAVPLAALLLALTGCAATSPEAEPPETTAPAQTTERDDGAVCAEYAPTEDGILTRATAVLSALDDDPTGSTIDQPGLRLLVGDMSRARLLATDELRLLLEPVNAPIETLAGIFFEGQPNQVIDTSTFEADSLAILDYCIDAGYTP